MGLMSLFGKGPLSERQINKAAKLATNPFAQPDVRMKEMHRLLSDGSVDALRGLLRRFNANASGHIADEDEKQWLEEQIVEAGDIFQVPLREYIEKSNKLSYALRAYKRTFGVAEATRFFIDVLDRYGPEDYRGAEAKLQLVWALGEALEDDRVLPVLMPFIRDHSDDVIWAVMDLLDQAADRDLLNNDQRDAACKELAECVLDAAVGPRIMKRAAELLCAREWQIPGDAEELAPLLDEDYFLDKKRYVRRRAKR